MGIWIASSLRGRQFEKKRVTLVVTLLCPHGDSNPSLGLERAPSWAPRRWGHLASLTHVSDMVCVGTKPRIPRRARFYHPKWETSIKHAQFYLGVSKYISPALFEYNK